MKRTKHFLLLLAATALIAVANAQTINGDLNHSGKLEVSDVTHLISNYLTGTNETISGGGDPFAINNSLVVGTWNKSEDENITFNADGTTDYGDGYTYEFLATQGYILFYNASGVPVYALRVLKATSDCLVILPAGSDIPVVYESIQPVSITLSQTSLELKPDEYTRLTATVLPSDAGTVTWSSSDESIATVVSGFVTAVAEGTAIITAEVAGAKATCEVTVIDAVSTELEEPEKTVSIVGTWKYTFSSGYTIKQFNADGTGYSQEYDANDGGWHSKHYFTYTYNEAQQKLYRTDSDGESETYEVRELTATTLTLYNLTYPDSKALTTYTRQEEQTETISIVGTWKHTFSSGYTIKQFNADGTGYSQEYDANDGGWHSKHNFTYIYDEAQQKLYRTDSDGESETYEVRELTATTLTLYNLTYPDSKALTTYTRQ